MSFLKSLWAKWKVSISFVGGALVVATTYGTCTVEPDKEAIVKEVIEKKEEAAEESKEESKEEPKEESKEKPKEADKPAEETVVDKPSEDQ